MNGRHYFIFSLFTIAVVSLSCGLKKAFSGRHDDRIDTNAQIKPLTEALANNNDYFGQEPLPNNQPGADAAPSNGDGNAEPNDNAPVATLGPLAPSNPPATGDFEIQDVNGVYVSRKNGMLKTIFPNGEEYFTPEQI